MRWRSTCRRDTSAGGDPSYRRDLGRKHFAGATGVLIGLLLTTTGGAFATNDLGNKAGTDSTVTFLKYYLTATVSSAFDFNDTNSIEVTSITTTIYVTTSGDNDIYYPKEVNVYDFDYGDTGWYGQYYCQTWGGGNVCSVGKVLINLYPEPPLPLNDTEARSLVCEETGHSVGLDHSGDSDSCMSQDWNDNLLNAHDKGILNGRY